MVLYYFLSTYSKQPCILLIEHDSWDTIVDVCLCNQLLQWKENGRIIEIPKVVLVTSESDKTKAGSDVDTMIMKPVRASTVVARFQQVLGMEKQQSRDRPNGLASLNGLLDGKNMLVVDDNKVNLTVATGVLKKYGAKVECAESGKDALSLLQLPHKFDGCFMDVQMPEMDGFEATRQIRLIESKANENNRIRAATLPEEGSLKTEWHLPILPMATDVVQATYEECLKCGMDGYVSKPFEEVQLYQAVAEFLVLDS